MIKAIADFCIFDNGKNSKNTSFRKFRFFKEIKKHSYLYGSYSPINGNSFVWEINGVDTKIFESYLYHFSQYKPKEYKIVIIDNTGFHSTKNIEVPDNIFLLRISPYAPELNPCEQVWQYIKNRYKNQRFENMEILKNWLHNMVRKMDNNLIKSITSNHHYLNVFNAVL